MVSFELGKETEKEVFCLVTRFIYVWILASHTHVTCHQLNNLYSYREGARQKERTFCAIKFTNISPGVPAISSMEKS